MILKKNIYVKLVNIQFLMNHLKINVKKTVVLKIVLSLIKLMIKLFVNNVCGDMVLIKHRDNVKNVLLKIVQFVKMISV